MSAYLNRHRLILPIAPTVGGALGLAFAVAIAVMPAVLLDRIIDLSHIPAVVAAAAPPLGATARMLLVLVGGGGLAVVVGLGLFLLIGRRTFAVGRTRDHGLNVPVLRRADAHPDAPPRAPVMAHRDLGAPLLDVPIELPLPADLDQPLAAFDPGAIPDVPRAPVPSVAPLVRIARPQLIDPGDRFETFDPAPLAAAIEPTATIHALLDRLERGVTRRTPSPARAPAAAADDLQAALATLRGLASDAA
jgi:hypothetical protein